MRNNEGKCCDAVLRILEQQHQARRAEVMTDAAAQPGIEVTCTIGGQHYALEHTLIEPFSGNQKDNIDFQRVFDDSLEAQFSDVLNPEVAYDVSVDVYAFSAKKAKELSVVRQALIAWIRTALPQLPAPSGFRQTSIEAKPPEVPVRIRLSSHRSKTLGGRLLPARFAPPALEALRRTRLLKALNDKAPKLHAARRKEGTRTVLVVENPDIALTNAGLVGELFQELSAEVAHMPDDIYMVDVSTGNKFFVSQIRDAGVACLNVGPDAGDWEFDAAALDDLLATGDEPIKPRL